MSYLKQYDFLINNGIPFELDVYDNGTYTFHIFLGDSYIMTGCDFDAVDYYQFKLFCNRDIAYREELLKLHPGTINYLSFV